MTEQEYNQSLSDLKDKYESDKRKIDGQYAIGLNPYNIGDIIKDHNSILKIEKIGWSYSYSGPTCLYKGIELKADLNPSKKQSCTTMYLSNVKQKLN